VVLFENFLSLWKQRQDVFMYVLCPSDENELIALAVLTALDDALQDLLRKDNNSTLSKKSMLENIELVVLAIDELVDDGMILETDPFEVSSRVSMASAIKDIPLSEQTFSQALANAKDQFVRSWT